MILGFEEGIPACKPYNEEIGDGCSGENCSECVWIRFTCIDCEKCDECDFKFKPKILPSNRQALNLYSLCLKFRSLPNSGGVLDQPHRLLQQFQIIMDEVGKQEEIERKKMKDKKE